MEKWQFGKKNGKKINKQNENGEKPIESGEVINGESLIDKINSAKKYEGMNENTLNAYLGMTIVLEQAFSEVIEEGQEEYFARALSDFLELYIFDNPENVCEFCGEEKPKDELVSVLNYPVCKDCIEEYGEKEVLIEIIANSDVEIRLMGDINQDQEKKEDDEDAL